MSRLRQWNGLRAGQDYEIETRNAHYTNARVEHVDRGGVTLRFVGHSKTGRSITKHDRVQHADVRRSRRLRD